MDMMMPYEANAKGRSIMEALNSGPEYRQFQTAEEVTSVLER